jgi:NAD(P)-dependent dehydrogenase (short-subunit alcohol dehydrogenase family)
MGATNVSFDFSGQAVVVTGTGKGIGRSIALAFATARLARAGGTPRR